MSESTSNAGSEISSCLVADTGSPLMSYDSVTSNLNRLAKSKNFTMFSRDLANNKLPQWMFITPNMSMHVPRLSRVRSNSIHSKRWSRQLPGDGRELGLELPHPAALRLPVQ